MTQTTTINVDISRPNIPAVVYAKQHDIDTRKVEVSLYDNGNEYTVPASVSGQVNIGKPDGTGCYYDVDSISGNKVTFTLVEQALAAYGEATVEVSLISTEDDNITERLTSFSFRLIIEKRAIEDSSIVSSDYYNALVDLAGTVIRSVTFTPSVNSNGDISWTNNGGLTNPETVNIKGPQGATGATGATGAQGPAGSSAWSGVEVENKIITSTSTGNSFPTTNKYLGLVSFTQSDSSGMYSYSLYSATTLEDTEENRRKFAIVIYHKAAGAAVYFPASAPTGLTLIHSDSATKENEETFLYLRIFNTILIKKL